jgi:hypothetical protein
MNIFWRSRTGKERPPARQFVASVYKQTKEELMEQSTYCSECWHGVRVDDFCGTGDSPSVIECMAQSPDDCPYVEDHYED